MAARTIPFPISHGTAATQNATTTPPPPPPTGAAKLTTPRRYRGLHVVPRGYIRKISLNSLAQTQAIVAQVEREIEQRMARARVDGQIHLLTPHTHSSSLPSRTARRVLQSLFPAGL